MPKTHFTGTEAMLNFISIFDLKDTLISTITQLVLLSWEAREKREYTCTAM